MTDINSSKFLAELGRLLTFMHDEDKKTALDMYEKLFEEAVDEQALTQMLVSPTRQAVVMARSYDAAGRKLDIAGGEDDEGLPEFVIAIDKLYQSAAAKGLLIEEESGSAVLENQVSLFEDTEELFAEAEEEAPAEESAEEEAHKEEAPEAVEEPAAEEKSEPVDEVDAFLAEFSISDEALGVEAPKTEEKPAEEEKVEEPEAPVGEEKSEELSVPAEVQEELPEKGTVRKVRAGLLILYLIFAIPLTAVGVVLLLIPTLLVLALAAVVVTLGVAALIAAFSGFAVFADVLIVLGAALIILALGLLLLWLFVWFVGGAIVGLIHGAISLAGKWCYKEVPAV